MVLFLINCCILFAGKISSRESYIGLKYGLILSSKSPGRKPKFSPASTTGLVITIFLIIFSFNALMANTTLIKFFTQLHQISHICHTWVLGTRTDPI